MDMTTVISRRAATCIDGWCRWLLLVATLLGLNGVPFASNAQGYPDRAVKVIVPFPAGGTIDVVGRVVTQRMAQALGQPFVMENRAGAGGAIGAEAAAKSAPDGYTLFIGAGSTHGTNSAVSKSLPYDPIRDFAPIGLIVNLPYILVAHPSLPANNTAELIALARKDPGKLNFASYGNGSSNHLAMELFKAMTGIDVVHVPYKGGAPAIADLVAGQVQFMFEVFPTSGPHIKSGKLKLLGVGSAQRSTLAPATTTLGESGASGFDAGTFAALFAPAATPRTVIDTLNRELNRALADSATRARFVELGVEGASGSPDQLGARVADEVRKWSQLVKERNLRFD